MPCTSVLERIGYVASLVFRLPSRLFHAPGGSRASLMLDAWMLAVRAANQRKGDTAYDCRKARGLRRVRQCGLAVRRQASKQKDIGSIRFGSLFSSKIMVYGHCLVTLPTQLMKHYNVSHSCPPQCIAILVVTVSYIKFPTPRLPRP